MYPGRTVTISPFFPKFQTSSMRIMGTDLLAVIPPDCGKRDGPNKGELGSKTSNRSTPLMFPPFPYRRTCIRRSR